MTQLETLVQAPNLVTPLNEIWLPLQIVSIPTAPVRAYYALSLPWTVFIKELHVKATTGVFDFRILRNNSVDVEFEPIGGGGAVTTIVYTAGATDGYQTTGSGTPRNDEMSPDQSIVLIIDAIASGPGEDFVCQLLVQRAADVVTSAQLTPPSTGP